MKNKASPSNLPKLSLIALLSVLGGALGGAMGGWGAAFLARLTGTRQRDDDMAARHAMLQEFITQTVAAAKAAGEADVARRREEQAREQEERARELAEEAAYFAAHAPAIRFWRARWSYLALNRIPGARGAVQCGGVVGRPIRQNFLKPVLPTGENCVLFVLVS